MPSTLQASELRVLVDSVPTWWHSIELGDGIVTPGHKTPQILEGELERCKLPDLRGRSVLDIGAWDGFFSFHAEHLGASRVVALDHYVWSIDLSKAAEYGGLSGLKGSAEEFPEVWRPADLPGKRGFDLAHRALSSHVEPVVADFMETDLSALGQFDVVFYFGVLYHMRHPLLALERLAKVTRDLAVIETEAVWIPDFEDHAMVEFFETDERHEDATTWWAPNAKALVGMCRAAGFRRVDLMVSLQPDRRHRNKAIRRLRGLRHSSRPFGRGRLIAHAYK